jgi:hypothetical protein
MEIKNKELPIALTIEELQKRVNKPVFMAKYNEISNKVDLRWVIFKSLNQEILEFTDGVEDLKIGDYICFFYIEVTEEELKQYIEQQLKEILTEEKAKKKTGYERVKNKEIYYFLGATFKPTTTEFYKTSSFDEQNYKNANHFNDENLAKNIARAEKLKYQLRRYAALNGGIPSQKDWQNRNCCKYYICYDYEENKIDVCDRSFYKDFGQIYFKDREACKKAMEIFKDELLWLFTEFEEQLY